MRTLRTLADVAVQLIQPSSAAQQSDHGTGTTKVQELFSALRNGAIISDDDARRLLYPDRHQIPATTYRSIKTRLFDDLCRIIAGGTSGEATDFPYDNARANALQYLHVIHVLRSVGEDEAAETVALRLLRLAKRFMLSAEVVAALRALAGVQHSRGQAMPYPAEPGDARYWIQVLAAEQEALDLSSAHLCYSVWQGVRKDIQPELEKAVQEIGKLRAMYPVHTLHLLWYEARRKLAVACRDFDDVLCVYSEMHEYFKEYPFLKSGLCMARITIDAMLVWHWRCQPERADRLQWECEDMLRAGTDVWMEYRMRVVIMNLGQVKHDAAAEYLREMQQYVGTSMYSGDDYYRDVCQMLRVYVQFAAIMNGHDPDVHAEHGHSPPVTRRAHEGKYSTLNACIAVAHILDAFMRCDYAAIELRDESLQTLRRKKLRHISARLDVFVRLLHIMTQCDFDAAKTQRQSARLAAELRTRRLITDHREPEVVELLPFDQVWQTIVRVMKERKEAGIGVL
ncbi:MAG: hypothetical protein ACK5JL_08465 [Candidatus Kapaibacterium sp.]|jgi:hypothetical protein